MKKIRCNEAYAYSLHMPNHNVGKDLMWSGGPPDKACGLVVWCALENYATPHHIGFKFRLRATG